MPNRGVGIQDSVPIAFAAPMGAARRITQPRTRTSGVSGIVQKAAPATRITNRPAHLKPRRVSPNSSEPSEEWIAVIGDQRTGREEEERTHLCKLRKGQAIPEETRDERVGHPRREKREESFMPVEIIGAWFRAEKGIGGRIVLGWFAPGLKPRPPKEGRRAEPHVVVGPIE
jgi:hypothetical protein